MVIFSNKEKWWCGPEGCRVEKGREVICRFRVLQDEMEIIHPDVFRM